MKIIEGSLAGAQVYYKEQKGTRVTTDKVRKAVFDVLKNIIDIDDLKIADLFCGSGMFGVEALSRGAGNCVFVDDDKSIIQQLRENLSQLKVENFKVENRKFENFIEHYSSTQEHGTNNFDLVFADPPYYKFDFTKFNDIYKILNKNGIFVLESSKRVGVGKLNGLELMIEKVYGDARVLFYKNI